jgi:hypothetical protein
VEPELFVPDPDYPAVLDLVLVLQTQQFLRS